MVKHDLGALGLRGGLVGTCKVCGRIGVNKNDACVGVGNNLWLCIAGDQQLVVICARAMLTAYEVRQFAARKLGAEPPSIDVRLLGSPPTYDGSATLVEVRWTGSDFSHGGSTDGRRMQERSASTEEWTNV